MLESGGWGGSVINAVLLLLLMLFLTAPSFFFLTCTRKTKLTWQQVSVAHKEGAKSTGIFSVCLSLFFADLEGLAWKGLIIGVWKKNVLAAFALLDFYLAYYCIRAIACVSINKKSKEGSIIFYTLRLFETVPRTYSPSISVRIEKRERYDCKGVIAHSCFSIYFLYRFFFHEASLAMMMQADARRERERKSQGTEELLPHGWIPFYFIIPMHLTH